MIQRIQSVYLTASGAALIALSLRVFTLSSSSYAGVAAAMAVIVSLGAVGAVFLFKHRSQQRRLIVLVQVATIALIVVFFGGLYLEGALQVRTAQGVDTAKAITLLLPIVAYLLLVLARRAVTKDIGLVRSVGSLR